LGYVEKDHKNFGKLPKPKSKLKFDSKCKFCKCHGYRELFCPKKMNIPFRITPAKEFLNMWKINLENYFVMREEA